MDLVGYGAMWVCNQKERTLRTGHMGLSKRNICIGEKNIVVNRPDVSDGYYLG